jgi:uncharacterized membrane protein YfcA
MHRGAHNLENPLMLYVFSGLFVGFVVGLTGVGGGSLMTPILVLLFGVHPATAVGTDLLYAAATKSVGTMVHGFEGAVVWRVTGALALGSVPTSLALVVWLGRTGPFAAETSALITSILGYALLLTSAAMLSRKHIMEFAASGAYSLGPATRFALTVLTGVILGVLVSLSSVGAGALGVTALILLYPEMRTSHIVGSDIAHAVPLTLIAGVGHWMIGSVNFPTLGLLLTGSIPGIVAGSLLAPRLPDYGLRLALATVLIIVGARLIFA